MNVRKITIPTITLLIIASQLMGCASATQKEMLEMYNNNQSVTIEIAEPINQEQGTEVHIDWEELAYLDSYEAFRMSIDDAIGITTHGDAGKNGVLYVDLDGNHTNNSTLYYAFANQKFRDNVWNNSDISKVFIEEAQNIYTDVESDKASLLAGYNAYYNLLNDSEPGYANMHSTISRLEAMSMIFKADTPVYEIEINEDFAATVENEQLAPYAQEMNNYCFLKTDNLSLDGNTANSTITRAEFVYMIVQRYFADDYAKVTGEESCYSDAKNGGDVATEIKLITTDKETGETIVKKRCESYELAYCIRDEKAGMPEELYKALVVAQQKDLITGTESRWSDGLIKGEALTILTNAYMQLDTKTNADRGASSGEVVNQIDWELINPATHVTYDAETETITADDTIVNTLIEKSPYFMGRDEDNVKRLLQVYLPGYFTDRFGDDEWLQFVITGDNTHLNLELTDAEMDVLFEQELEAWFVTEEGQAYLAEKQAKEGEYNDGLTAAGRIIVEEIMLSEGVSKEEAIEIYNELHNNSDSATNNESTQSGNNGGGSAPVVSPETNQSAATEGNFVTPETSGSSNNGGYNDLRPGETILTPSGLGDGGKLITDIMINP